MDDTQLIAALKAGDEKVFAMLMDEWDSSMLRLALMYVPSRAVAEEVLQETWLAVVRGLDRFEGRSSLKTWVFRILVNQAKTRGQRERRSVPLSSLQPDDEDAPAVDPDRFLPADHPTYPGHWAAAPEAWPEDALLAGETREVIEDAIEALPERQRAVITMRDIEGLSSSEVRNALDLSETNQRVLLHRARSRVRAELERYFG